MRWRRTRDRSRPCPSPLGKQQHPITRVLFPNWPIRQPATAQNANCPVPHSAHRLIKRSGEPEIVFKFRHPDIQVAAETDVRPHILGDYRVKFKCQALPLKDVALLSNALPRVSVTLMRQSPSSHRSAYFRSGAARSWLHANGAGRRPQAALESKCLLLAQSGHFTAEF
jgi:hypothetical protein